MAVDVSPPIAREGRTLPAIHTWPGVAWHVFKDVVKWPFYALYEYRMAQLATDWRKPQHIGVIMDGNRRFARQYGFTDISEGHEHGARHL